MEVYKSGVDKHFRKGPDSKYFQLGELGRVVYTQRICYNSSVLPFHHESSYQQ